VGGGEVSLYHFGYLFLRMHKAGTHIYEKSRNHHITLGARTEKLSKFHTEDPQIEFNSVIMSLKGLNILCRYKRVLL
jgi:hypothetical protein